MFNDRALGVDAPLWNMPELHLWGEVLSYRQRTHGRKSSLTGRCIFKMSVCPMAAYLFQLTERNKCLKGILNVFTRL